MRKLLLALVTAPLLFSSVAFTSVGANALPLPTGVTTQGSSGLLQEVDCRRVWRCGFWGCGWRDVCWRDRDDWRWRDRDEWREGRGWRHDDDYWRWRRYHY